MPRRLRSPAIRRALTAPAIAALLRALLLPAVVPAAAWASTPAAPGTPPRPAPRRIAALAPSAAEILFALGAGPRVVAVSDFAGDVPGAAGKPTVGGFTPDLERLLALAPDLVVVSRDGTDRSAWQRLVALGVPVLVTRGTTLRGVLDDVAAVGEAAGEAGRAAKLVRDLSDRIEAASARAREAQAKRPFPSAVAVIWPDPPVVAGPRSFVGDLLRVAGATNAVPESAGEWPRVSHESLAAWDPGVLVRPETAENAEAFRRAFVSDPRWRLVPAARDGRVVVLPGSWLERPGPRLVDALERLVSLLSERRP